MLWNKKFFGHLELICHLHEQQSLLFFLNVWTVICIKLDLIWDVKFVCWLSLKLWFYCEKNITDTFWNQKIFGLISRASSGRMTNSLTGSHDRLGDHVVKYVALCFSCCFFVFLCFMFFYVFMFDIFFILSYCIIYLLHIF